MSPKEQTAAALRSAVDRALPLLNAIPDAESARPRAPGKWCACEVIGHLIDSACVNHQRFVRGALSDDLDFPGYEQESWVQVQEYATMPWSDLVAFWAGYNHHLAGVIERLPDESVSRARARHSLDRIAFRRVEASTPATLGYLMDDYVVHLEHHLAQVLGAGWQSAASTHAPRTADKPGDAFLHPPRRGFIIETTRLRLREMTEADLPFVAEMLGDAEVMRFYPKPLDLEGARGWLQRQLHRYATDGHGLWLVEERATGSPVGQVGLAMQEVDTVREPEIGWLIHRSFWRRGYASEAGTGVRQYAFNSLRFRRVISLIRPVNEPSQGVARKVGMAPERETHFHGYDHVVFAVRRRDLERGKTFT